MLQTLCNKSNVTTNVANTLSTNMTNTISTYSIASTVSIDFHDKKVRYKMDCFIFHTVLLVIILLFRIAIICYHYAKQIKAKIYWRTNIKMENNELKENCIKNCKCYYFDDIIKIEDFNNILLDEKSCKNILIFNVSYKTLIGETHCISGSIK